MSTCKICRKLLEGALYQELNQHEMAEFVGHLQTSDSCAKNYRQMQQTIELMNQRKAETPSAEFWARFQENLENRLADETIAASGNKKFRIFELNGRSKLFSWTYRVAGAFLLVISGIFIGKILFAPEKSRITQIHSPATQIAQPTAAESAAYDYIEKSKLLLLGIVNLEGDFEKSANFDFSLQREVASNLLQQSGQLTADLSQPHQRKLRSLVTDLEGILLQISNLELKHDLSAIEVIKYDAEQKAIFLKINLHELNRINFNSEQEKGSAKNSNKAKI